MENITIWQILKNKDFYPLLVTKDYCTLTGIIKLCTKLEKLEIISLSQWENILTLTKDVARETKIINFHFKLVHYIINWEKLKDWKIIDNNKCTHCDKVDDIIHFMVKLCMPICKVLHIL